MATILEFRPQARSQSGATRGAAAEIVFFPGVRYERWDDVQQDDERRAIKRRDVIDQHDDRE